MVSRGLLRRGLASAALLATVSCTRESPSTARPDPVAATSTASSPPTPEAKGAPEKAWADLLDALMRKDEPAIVKLTTKNGLDSLRQGHGADWLDAVAGYAKGWSKWEVRWKKRSDTRAEAVMGPEVKEHGLLFVRDADGWKLEKWSPGE